MANILTVLSGFCHVALNENASPEQRVASIERAAASADQAIELCRQITSFSRRNTESRALFDFNQVVAELAGAQRYLRVDAAVETAFASGPLMVLANRIELTQIVLNIVLNAAQAVLQNSGKIQVDTLLELVKDGRTLDGEAVPNLQSGVYARLNVQDNGPGIPPEIIGRIFDPLFTTKSSGGGLGLFVVAATVQSLGGRRLGAFRGRSRSMFQRTAAGCSFLPERERGGLSGSAPKAPYNEGSTSNIYG